MGVAETCNFNKQTAPNAHDIYVVFPSSAQAGKVEVAKVNLDSQTASYMKGHEMLSGNQLDVNKTQSISNVANLDKGATYYAAPDFMDAVRIDYNRSMVVAEEAGNVLAAELDGDKVPKSDSLNDLVGEYNEIQNWEHSARALESLIRSAEASPMASDLKVQVKDARDALEGLQYSGAFAQQSAELYIDVSKPASPDVKPNTIDFDSMKNDAAPCSGDSGGSRLKM